MKRLIYISFLALAALCMAPNADAQGRGGGRHHGGAPSVSRPSSSGTSRPGSMNRPSGVNRPGNVAPSHGGNKPGAGNKPGNSHHPGNVNHPGGTHHPGNVNRPGGNRPNPGHGPVANPGRPHPGNPGHVAPGRPHPGHFAAPPYRPMRPAWRPWGRPLPPPPGWRPVYGGPVVSTILGVAIGTSVALTIDALANRGYAVDGYDNGVVYVRNVYELGYSWPDAAMYYGPAGGLVGSQFYYSLPYDSTVRYSQVYNSLVGRYGPPVSRSGAECVWYGPSSGYISLNYGLSTNSLGSNVFVTTLTFGN